ncbi:MAG TPA: hypothetical protein VF596_11905 [Pyrinomonadaceae bacterium]|jgi:hypothetical protein
MSVISAPSLSLSDFFQKTFPSVIAVCLFVPFFPVISRQIGVEGLIVSGGILGYIISPIVEWMYKKAEKPILHIYFCFKKPNEQEQWYQRWRWHLENWDFDQLLYSLNKDDREFLNNTYGFVKFNQITCFYFLLYALTNVYWLISALPESKSALTLVSIWEIKTPMLGGNWALPTLLVIITSFILTFKLFIQALSEASDVCLQYIVLAKNYHQEKGHIAKRVWGKLIRKNKENTSCLNRYKIVLKKNNLKIDSSQADESGFFRFDKKYEELIGLSNGNQILNREKSDLSEIAKTMCVGDKNKLDEFVAKYSEITVTKFTLEVTDIKISTRKDEGGKEIPNIECQKEMVIKEKVVPYAEMEVC